MSIDTYICSCCGYLVIFRNWNGKNHHPIHLPTGWPCYRMVENGDCSSPESLPFPVGESEGADERAGVTTERAVELYRRYRRGGPMAPLRDLVDVELAAGRVATAQRTLEEILYRFPSDRQLTSWVAQVISSDEWLALVERARQAVS